MPDRVEVIDVRSTKAEGKRPLYAPRIRIHPKRVSGTFRRLKWIVLVVLLGIYYGAPWLRWDRGPGVPDQALLIDMPHRRAYFFFIEIWPQEIYFLAGLLILAALGLFLVTGLLGRVWCGYACPQTVWTDLFMLVERRIEGDRNARIRLDKARWGLEKLARKVVKHAVWLVIAALTGGAWIMYFNDAPTVLPRLALGQASGQVYFFFGLLTTTTYLLAGWAREQVCTYMCPWPRFQGAMFDEDTLIVTYQAWRGEPRGKHKRGDSWEGRGDCVDCNRCVAVCPTGIDIRDGLQLECIGCALCIDACNDVMDKVGRPRGLITYTTSSGQAARAAGRPARYRLLRPRTLIYTMLMLVAAGLMVYALATRSTLEMTVLPHRTPLFVTLSDGAIRNGYTFRILNKTRQAGDFLLAVDGLRGAEISVVGQDGAPAPSAVLEGAADGVSTYHVYVAAPRASLSAASTSIDFTLTDLDTGASIDHRTVFRGPAP